MSGAGGGKSRLESEMVSNEKSALFITAVMFGAMGIGLTLYILLYFPVTVYSLFILVGTSGIMFTFVAYSAYRLLTMDRKAEREAVYGPHVCKHCGRRFMKKKEWSMHEKSCVEMRI